MIKTEDFNNQLTIIRSLIQTQTEQLPYEVLKKILVDSFQNFKSRNLLGIFFKFSTIITTMEGDVDSNVLVDNLAHRLAESGFVVIAGDFIYEKEDKKIHKETTILESLKEILKKSRKDDYLIKTSDLISSLTPLAIFLLLNKHSASVIEESNFHDEKTVHKNKKSIAVGFTDEPLERFCKQIVMKEIANMNFLECASKNFELGCKEEINRCYFTKKLGLSASLIQLHVNRSYSSLILVNKHKNLDKIVLNLMKLETVK